MPEVQFRSDANSVDTILAEYDRRKDDFEKLRAKTENLINDILDTEKIQIQSVQGRVKSRDKLKSKYCKQEKEYKHLDDIPDVVGLRIITYYSDTIDRIAEIIKREFAQLNPMDDKRIGKPESFGYSALHMDCTYSVKRLESTEYKRFASERFEIQITTVLGHAWAEMHHAWYDSSDAPTEEERRFLRLAAVLELAEQEFLEIRKKKHDRERIASVQVAAAAESPDIPITLESLKAFIEQKDIVRELDVRLAIMFGSMNAMSPDEAFLIALSVLVNGVGIRSIQKLESNMRASGDAVIEFVRRLLVLPNITSSAQRTSYYKGLSIFQFASILAGALGVESYSRLLMHGSIISRGSNDKLIQIAKEVASEFHLS
jgi:ppGpp synthetase/RelA/SpoT-type nucleotidyltranferase